MKKETLDYKLKYYPSNIKIFQKKPIAFSKVFEKVMFFKDSDHENEFNKFKGSIGHMNRFISRYENLKWYEAQMSIIELLNVYMCPVGWLRRFACINEKCKNFKNEECINCLDDEMKIFTLYDTMFNFTQKTTKFAEKIYSIMKRIKAEEDTGLDFLFCTLVRNKYKKYFVMDGNSRLLSFAIRCKDKSNLYDSIKCYIGEK
jgi:hypothetical protein